MAVEDHVPFGEFDTLKGRVCGDLHGAVAAIPERLGVEPGPGQPPGVFLGRPLGSDNEDEAIALAKSLDKNLDRNLEKNVAR